MRHHTTTLCHDNVTNCARPLTRHVSRLAHVSVGTHVRKMDNVSKNTPYVTYIQIILPVTGFAGTQHTSVAWDLVLHPLQKTSS